MKIERMNEGFTLQCRWRMQKQWLAPSLLILFPCVGFFWLRYFNVYILWKDDFIEEDLMLVKNEEFKGIFDNDNYSAVLTLCGYSFTRENLELIRELTNEMIERLSYADFFGKNSAMRRLNRLISSSITPLALCGEKCWTAHSNNPTPPVSISTIRDDSVALPPLMHGTNVFNPTLRRL